MYMLIENALQHCHSHSYNLASESCCEVHRPRKSRQIYRLFWLAVALSTLVPKQLYTSWQSFQTHPRSLSRGEALHKHSKYTRVLRFIAEVLVGK
jgi:hypothetical protein